MKNDRIEQWHVALSGLVDPCDLISQGVALGFINGAPLGLPWLSLLGWRERLFCLAPESGFLLFDLDQFRFGGIRLGDLLC